MPIDTDEGQIICNLIAVHAGLERTIDLNEQLRVLRTRDTRVPKVQMLSGRQDVWDTPKVKKICILFLSSLPEKKHSFLVFNIYQLGETIYSAECENDSANAYFCILSFREETILVFRMHL